MKKIAAIIITFIMLITAMPSAVMASDEEQMRAAWIVTVFNLDYPTSLNDSNAQKQEFAKRLDELKAIGINTVFVQVRPKGDAFYTSSINPWSEFLTGTQGQNPGYDPLKYMVDEAHNRGMKIHAWLNPFRATTSGTDVSTLAENNPARLHPDWLINDGSKLTFDPSNDNVKQLISDTAKEIVVNYQIDGLLFDDYFYPNGYALRSGETAEDRISNVSEIIKKVYDTVHTYGNNVQFGVSPMGICVSTDDFWGGESVSTVYADPRQWIQGGYIDYISPQIYWSTSHSSAAYEKVLKWWNDAVNGTNVKLYISEAVYKEDVAVEIATHLEICKKYGNVDGNAFYSTKYLVQDFIGCATAITAFYVGGGTSTTPVQPAPNTPQQTKTAIATPSTIMVDGMNIPFESYNIDGYNYFKLRDIAASLNGTEKQFDTVWNEAAQAIDIKTSTTYTFAGGELTKGSGVNKTAATSTATLYMNGSAVEAEAYNIDGMNYYKLRDIAKKIDFAVIWSEETNSIGIVSMFGYD